jgi:pilus assembly protein Flp/PilA
MKAWLGVESVMQKGLLRYLLDKRGATAIEYALIAGFISIAIVAAVNSLGITLSGTFAAVAAGP